MTLNWLDRWAQLSPDRIAIREGETNRTYSYKQALVASQKMATVLTRQYAIKRGDFVALLASNEIETVLLFFALARIGATLIPINSRNTEREVLHILNDSKAKLLLLGDAYLEKITSSLNCKTLSFEEFIQISDHTPNNSKDLYSEFKGQTEDAALVIYTSGTTGAPKGALLSQKMVFWNSINTTLRLNLSETDKTIIFLPFFHTGGWNVLSTPLFHRGGEVIFIKKFNADLVLKLSQQHKTTLLFGVPTTMRLLAESVHFSSSDLSSLRYAVVGGEPMPVPLIEAWHSKKIPIRQGYGLTEFGPNVFSLSEVDAIRKIGSIGFPNFYVETRVVNDEMKDCKTNEVGELLLRGPSVMSGYLNNKAATEEAFFEDWLRTGDLVKFDEENYFFVVGRKKEMYKSGGENVYPVEVEKVIQAFPGIKEVAVVGIKDPKWGEVGKAFIVVDPSGWSEDLLQKHCEKNLAKFKIPAVWEYKTELPKSDSGKILKRQLV